MKKYCKLLPILGVLVFALAACNRDEGANAPDLIEPAEGAVASEAPTFVWSSVPLIEDYRIAIDSGSSSTIYTPTFKVGKTDFTTPVIEEDLYDTTYTMSGADFDKLEDGTYYWKVASLKYPPDGSAPDVNWSEVRSFRIEKADTSSLTAPDLIEPADGAVLGSEPPTFIWDSQLFADGYTIVVNDDPSMTGDTVFSQDLHDTTCTMPASDFEKLVNGTYYWTAAAYDDPADGSARLYYWNEVCSIIVEEPAPFDLDTTYFPFGMDYEWVYEVEYWEEDYRYETRGSTYDTISVLVIDSIPTSSGWIFLLDGGVYDVGYDTVEIEDGKILVFEYCVGEDANVSLIPDKSEESYHVSIDYSADTLRMENYFQWSEPGMNTMEYDDWETTRIIGIGVIRQGHAYYLFKDMGMVNFARGASYRLLSFRKGGEVVWRR